MKNLKPGANQAEIAMLDLNRVVQDAPYGFIGIANNISPLFESFRRLKAETGSTKAAFGALGNSLVGPGGLGLALAAVTTAITFYQIGLQMWTRRKGTQKAPLMHLKKLRKN
ncbi:hypothetical protein LWM68_40965 [Niabella sp. W65]|nr:hypothetical protein [Niabella sp. W65]MCH7368545.1 hypothetical protein [Niabella sp. W65]ULT44134.1 hypothetical protein KRR40_12660 [Niabella sp. I65]